MKHSTPITKSVILMLVLCLSVACLSVSCSTDSEAEAPEEMANDEMDGDEMDGDEMNDDSMNEGGDDGSNGDGMGDDGSGNDGSDQDGSDDSNDQGGNDNDGSACTDPASFIFVEDEGLVVAEFEAAAFSDDWELRTDEPNFSGEGFMVWTGNQNLGNPGNGLATFRIDITTPGTYQFVWRSAVTIGNSGTDHNDTWLRFNDADDFFGQRGASVVYPVGSGKTPNPNGSSADGWFKIYRSGNDLGFKWQSSTSDNDAHDVFVTFDAPGTYTMEVSARSSGHAIDRFVLFDDRYSFSEATGATALSTINCN